MSLFSKEDYDRMHSLVFVDGYSGYKPTVAEIPNGDGKVDNDKKYAHIATKYLVTDQQKADLMPYLDKAFNLARAAADLARVPAAFRPVKEFCALRILDYPIGAGSEKHTDFDLFTLMCYRNQPEMFKTYDVEPVTLAMSRIKLLDKQAHLGELAEILRLGPATPHEVLPSTTDRQYSIVFFAIPDHDAVLPTGQKVGDWIAERIARSRTDYKPAT
jgi:hypothetical protein